MSFSTFIFQSSYLLSPSIFLIFVSGTYSKIKSNLDKYSAYLACLLFNFFTFMKYSKFLWSVQILNLLGVVRTWGWKSMELAWICTECRNSCNKLGDADLPERPWPQLMCCVSYKLHGCNFRDWSCKEL